ncbi:palmitoyltransferase ZDHHC23-A-like isoform X1 [Hypomesus transpacificus]|uniref:palmitoyltransferase ZDHHC23-A-like isoform X1 n=1 Tax=Hypomesus transpacificus TaxID=137520 RepID=UPI001F076109|nr:palmitoyltransferase ZDHHC23-A-like isoform X1 [Hypomesus transpacificus]
MKKEKFKPPEPDDPMCCCECDVDPCGCCCDSEDLDEACNRCLKAKLQNTPPVLDRLRLPLLSDDRQVEISMVPALMLLPVLLHVAALHFLLGIIILTAMPGLVLWYYYATHKKKRRTLFFLTLALYSLAYMYYLFLTEIVPRGDVSHLQLGTVTLGVVLTLVSLIHTKRGPGLVKPSFDDADSLNTTHGQELNRGSDPHVNGAGQCEVSDTSVGAVRLPAEAVPGKRGRCPVCKVTRPPRAGHCRICGACVLRLDHHCVWINSCVGQANHRSFLMTLLVFLLTCLYGIGLVLRSVCPRQYLLTALLYCPGVYNHYSSALCFTCAWYSSIVTGGLLHLLVLQLVNVSYNVTEREAQLALRNRTSQSRLCGLVVDTGVYSRGFLRNWTEFLTMGEPAILPSKHTNLV